MAKIKKKKKKKNYGQAQLCRWTYKTVSTRKVFQKLGKNISYLSSNNYTHGVS